jgi:hypothetical protein
LCMNFVKFVVGRTNTCKLVMNIVD